MNNDIYGILEQIASTSSMNEKQRLLKEQHDNKLFKEVLVAAYNPDINYYIKKIPAATESHPVADYHLHHAILDLAELSDRKRTGQEAIDFVATCIGMLRDEDADVFKRIIGRDLRSGFSEDTINKVWPKLIPSYPCQLCKPYSRKLIAKIIDHAVAQLKSDGMRFTAEVENGVCTLFTRNGKPLNLLGHLEQEFVAMADGQDVVFDGELLVRRNGKILSRKEGNGMIGRGVPAKNTMTEEIAKDIVASVWDDIPLKDFRTGKSVHTYMQRWAHLTLMITEHPSPRIFPIESTVVTTLEQAQEVFEKYLAQGLEGIILKSLKHGWEDKRVGHQVKFKAEKECDLEIIDYIEGNGKYAGMLGAWICATSDRKLVVKVAGMTDLERKTWWIERESMKGSIVAVMFNEVIFDTKKKIYSLFLPRIVEIRADKIAADTLKQVQAL